MTGLDEQAAALRRLVERLDDTATVLAGVREAVTGSWHDAAGREWDGRLDLVRRATGRLAGEAATRAAELERRATEEADAGRTGDDHGEPERAGDGLRIPGHTGIRVSERRGPVGPLLPPMEGGGAR